MTASPNFWAVYERLVGADGLSPRAARFVEAAMLGDAELAGVLDDSSATSPSERSRPDPHARAAPRAFLRRIEVSGFRGIGPTSRLDLEPGPGLTLVVGRNGSGKSSFVEGLELLLTGDSTRWTGKKPVRQWRSGWRNLHADGPVELLANLVVEGSSVPVSVRRRWGGGTGLDESELAVRRGTERLDGDLDELGWTSAMDASRPFLSYNDISGAWNAGPSKLFDALMGMLGMEDVRDALGRLASARKTLDKRRKTSAEETTRLVAELRRSSDPRAAVCGAALAARTPDLEVVNRVIAETEGGPDGKELATLRRLASLESPPQERVLQVVEALDVAADAREEASGSQAAQALVTADLLQQAVAWQESTGVEVCPVCGTTDVLDTAWRERAVLEIRAFREAAENAENARRQGEEASRAAMELVRTAPAPPGDLSCVPAAREAHAAWRALPQAPRDQARHLEQRWDALDRAYAACREQARAQLETLHADWRPLRRQIEGWLDGQHRVRTEAPDLAHIKEAEAWLKDVDSEIRASAFAPIAARAKQTWALLRAQSNVDIADVTLKGSATRRSVSLDVTVDGTEGMALGVMSQGELHAMALALFLPRLLRADSPFGFLLIDDPVQAMDPAKVDGLARVLQEAARTHQVVVFTHDPRLPAAVRRLGIDATSLEVRRNPTSQVDVRIGQDPVRQHISDALHVCRQRDMLGDEVVRHVVPGLCRSALEAALVRRVWRESLRHGVPHADIADRIERAHNIHALGTLAMFGDPSRGAELYARLNRIRQDAAEVFVRLKSHAHEPLPADVDLRAFIDDAEALARAVLA